MCERLASLKQAMRAWVRALDPAVVSSEDAGRALADVTAIEHMAATAKALLAARVAESGAWRRKGARSAADDIAKRTGASVGDALADMKLAERLAKLPA